MEKLPTEHSEYQWIADQFSKISGVELILLNTQAAGKELNMMLTNNQPGKSNKVFIFPLRTTFYLDYNAAPKDCPNDWDINLFEDLEMIMKIAMAKAKVIFEDMRVN